MVSVVQYNSVHDMTSERKCFFLWEYNLVVAYRMYMYVMDSDS